MKLNNIHLLAYNLIANQLTAILECDFKEATKLSGKTLTITNNGEDIAVFGGYDLTGIEKSPNGTRVTFAKELDPDTAGAIAAIETNQTIMHRTLNEASDTAQTAHTLAEANAAAIEELIPIVLGE